MAAKATPSKTSAKPSAGTGKSLIAAIESALLKKWDFQFNTVTSTIEYRERKAPGFNPVDDYQLNSLARSLLLQGVSVTPAKLRSIIFSDFARPYDPMKEYFTALPSWDRHTDHIQKLIDTVKTTDDILWAKCLRKWLVAMVGTMIDADVNNQTVLALAGKQGIGKTTWIQNLVPEALGRYYYAGIIRPDNRDCLVHLAECMLINLDELESLNRADIGSLKELITKDKIRIRRVYGTTHEHLIRRASFAGSVNNMDFLRDPTGSRRFLSFEVLHIDFRHSVSMDKVLAQAYHLFKAGFQYWFDSIDNAELEKNNELYTVTSMQEDTLLTHFEPCVKTAATHHLTTTEIMLLLSSETSIPSGDAEMQRLGKALRKHHFERHKSSGRQVYALRRRSSTIPVPET